MQNNFFLANHTINNEAINPLLCSPSPRNVNVSRALIYKPLYVLVTRRFYQWLRPWSTNEQNLITLKYFGLTLKAIV